MENEDGGVYLWDGQEVVNFQPNHLTHTTITKRSQGEKALVRIVHINGKQYINSLKKPIRSKSDFIYLLGGDLLWAAPTDQVECYSLRQKKMQYAPPMRGGRIYQSAVAASDDTIVVCGGFREPWNNSSCEIFSLIYQRYKLNSPCVYLY